MLFKAIQMSLERVLVGDDRILLEGKLDQKKGKKIKCIWYFLKLNHIKNNQILPLNFYVKVPDFRLVLLSSG